MIIIVIQIQCVNNLWLDLMLVSLFATCSIFLRTFDSMLFSVEECAWQIVNFFLADSLRRSRPLTLGLRSVLDSLVFICKLKTVQN